MPKRKVRTAAQIAASKRNLEKARREKARRIPVGKNVLLIHRTTPESANSIVAEQQFKPRKTRGDKVWFTPASSKSGAGFYKLFGTGCCVR